MGDIEANDQGHFLAGIPADQHLLAFAYSSYDDPILVQNLTERANQFFEGYFAEVNFFTGRSRVTSSIATTSWTSE